MSNIKKIFISHWGVVLITLLFICANAFFALHENYILLFFPFFLFLIYLSILSLDKLLLVVVYLVPVSLPLDLFLPDLGFNIQLPTEPILILITIFIGFKVAYERSFDRNVLLHPITIAIIINLGLIFITSLSSSMPLVSFKFLISRIWFVIPFYFLATQIFKNKNTIPRFVWAYVTLLMLVIGITLFKLVQAGLFNERIAHSAPTPFFNDHTEYGAVLAMVLPFVIGMAVNLRYSLQFRFLSWFIVFILSFAIVFSYCRAAWMSLFVAIFVFLCISTKIKFRWFVIVGFFVGIILLSFHTEIYNKVAHNRQDSSKDFSKHFKSMSNIQTDESNVERINRWKSAFRLFNERPLMGWGPGTYMFKYGAFQLPQDKTGISTNAGNRGNAHSEYFGALADSGIFGFLSFSSIVFVTLIVSMKIYWRTKTDFQIRLLMLSAILGLITYYVHGFMNDFLLNDKVSALFWGYTAMIVALDIQSKKKVVKELKELNSQ